MKIHPSTYVKVNFGENLRRFTKNSSHLYKNYFQFTLDALKNYFSHLVAVENAKTKQGERKYSLLNSLGKGQIRRRFSKMPSYRSLGKSKTVPLFSEFTARKQKEKAAIAACKSRFDSGFQLLKLCSDFFNHQIQELIYLNEQIAMSRNPILLF